MVSRAFHTHALHAPYFFRLRFPVLVLHRNVCKQSEFRAPFLVFPSVTLEESSSAAASGGGGGGYKVDVTVRVRADLPPQCYGTNVQVRVPLPRTAQVESMECGGRAREAREIWEGITRRTFRGKD